MVETITFALVKEPDLPMEVEFLTTDKLASKSVEEISQMQAYEGKIACPASDVFEITGEPATTAEETKIVIQGSTKKLRRIGENMTAGEIEIFGDVGMHVGDGMKGGKIVVHGSVDHYAASQMEGGELWVEGDAGDYLGAAYRGEWRGMKGGKIFIDGNVGFEMAAWLRGTKASQEHGEPLIHVKGNVGQHAGHHNHGGFIVIEGNAEPKLGSEMGRGEIVILGTADVLASFSLDEGEVDTMASLNLAGPFIVYSGDNGIGGKGKIYVKAPLAGEIVVDREALRAIAPAPTE
jgi:formylmethanofuran dehydrogenase subunit C